MRPRRASWPPSAAVPGTPDPRQADYPRPRGRLAALAATLLAAPVLAVPVLAGCGLLPTSSHPSHQSSAGPASAAAAASPAATPAPSPTQPCPATPARFTCAMRVRIAAVERYLKHRPGRVGIVLRDRSTGAVWENKYAHSQIYMASTSKLAMAVTLLMQNWAGVIHLSSADMATMSHMLHVSSDSAADTLWFKYGGSFYTSYFPKIGLTHARYLSVPSQGIVAPYWGEMTCPPADESRVVNFVLADMPASLRSYLVSQLRHVASVQHFGVWGAGAANHPGNKDGWSVELPGWIINSVGFAGPGARYTLAEMNSLDGQGGYRAGTDTVTQVAAILFRGHQISAPHVSATP